MHIYWVVENLVHHKKHWPTYEQFRTIVGRLPIRYNSDYAIYTDNPHGLLFVTRSKPHDIWVSNNTLNIIWDLIDDDRSHAPIHYVPLPPRG